MQYLPGPSKVAYRAKDGSKEKVFDALEWLAPMCSHAPPALKQFGSGSVRYVLDPFCQLSLNDDHLHRDPDYSWDAYLQS